VTCCQPAATLPQELEQSTRPLRKPPIAGRREEGPFVRRQRTPAALASLRRVETHRAGVAGFARVEDERPVDARLAGLGELLRALVPALEPTLTVAPDDREIGGEALRRADDRPRLWVVGEEERPHFGEAVTGLEATRHA